MTLISREDLRNQLKNDRVVPVYLFFGKETFLRDSAAKAITDRVLKDAPLREFNESSFNFGETDIQQILATAEQLPMIAARRVVRAEQLNKLQREADEEVLARYVARPAESCVLILVADELDKRRKLSKVLLENCTAVEFAPLEQPELLQWARRTLKDLQAEADEKALLHLIGLVGDDLRLLTNELKKLATASLPSGRITFDLVDELVANSRELSNFELTDHLIARNSRRALEVLQKILNDGAEPLMLLGLIASNYRRLAWAKEAMARGADREEVFRQIKLPFGKREEFLAIARRADSNALAHCLERIADADLAIKSSLGGGGASGARLQIEMLVCELANS